MANALTAVRLALALPVTVALARPELLAPGVVALLIGLAIVTDSLDGPVARRQGTASASGMLFDHCTDCLFVTSGLWDQQRGGFYFELLAYWAFQGGTVSGDCFAEIFAQTLLRDWIDGTHREENMAGRPDIRRSGCCGNRRRHCPREQGRSASIYR